MRRRLDLAAALVHRPPVLFLDEPTTGLDPQGRNELWGVIEELVDGGTTVLLTTQYLEEADRLADNIVVIDHGSVIAEGTADRAQGPARRDRDRGRVARRRRRADRAPRLLAPIGARRASTASSCTSACAGGDGAAVDARRRCASSTARSSIPPTHGAARADARRRVPRAHRPRRRAATETATRRCHRPRRRRTAMTASRRTSGDRRARAEVASARRRRRAHDRVAQPAEHPAQPAAARVRHDPAGHLRPDVPLRVRRRDPGQPPGGSAYINYLMPGIFVQTIVFGALTTGVGLADDLHKGLIDRFRSLPMARSAVLVGRTARRPRAQLLRGDPDVRRRLHRRLAHRAPTSSGLLGGVRHHPRVLLLAVVDVRHRRALSVKDAETAQAVSFPILAPLVFASSAFVPVATMPGWLQPWAEHQPVSVVIERGACAHHRRADERVRDQGDRLDRRHRRGVRADRRRPLPPGGLIQAGIAQYSGDQAAVRKSRLFHWSRNASASYM